MPMHTPKLKITRYELVEEGQHAGARVFTVKDENEPIAKNQYAQLVIAADKVTEDMQTKAEFFAQGFLPTLLPLFEDTPHRCKAREAHEREQREALEKEVAEFKAKNEKEMAELRAMLAQLQPKPNGTETPKAPEAIPVDAIAVPGIAGN